MLNVDDLKKYAPKMIAITTLARQLKNEGTHYLWGAQTDGSASMLPDRRGDNDNTFMRCATLIAGDTTHGVCAGRPDAADVKNKPPWNGQDPRALGSLYRWPRTFRDVSTDGSPKINGGKSYLVLGEDCTGKKHFDCAGFVRYCYRQVLGQGAIPAIGTMRSGAALVWPQPGDRRPLADVDAWPADLLYDESGHVGIATGHWLLTGFGVSEPSKAIHCYSASIGVVITGITEKVAWKYIYRWPKWG